MTSNTNKYVPLTCAFGALFVLFPVSALVWDMHLAEVFLLVILIVAIFTIEPKPLIRWISLALAVPSYGLLLFDHTVLVPLAHVTAICLLLIAWRAIVLDVLRHEQVHPNIIFGAIVVYCLIGAVWGHIYVLIDLIEPGNSFSFDGEMFFDYFYFSYVSLTTVGYGDMVPVSPIARGLAVFEAILGQVFLAVFIARLVGRLSHKAEQPSP